MKQKERHQKMMFDIINNFDFEKVHIAMVRVGWSWYPHGTPGIDELRFAARERIESVIKNCLTEGSPNQEYISSSGGLKARAIKDDYGQITFLELEFVLTSWDLNDPYDI